MWPVGAVSMTTNWSSPCATVSANGTQATGGNYSFFDEIPDLSRPAYSDNHIVDDAVRLTWQAKAKHKE